MADEPFYLPNRRSDNRQPTRGEEIWTLTKEGRTIRGELRSYGTIGIEFQVFGDDGLTYGHYYASRDFALHEAHNYRRQREAEGWTAP